MGLSIEAVAEQFITQGTKNFDLVIDIEGDPDTVDVTGHMESFYSDWDAANDALHIKADEVLRLITGVTWDVSIAKGSETVNAKIQYNVIPGAPIFQTLSTIHLYRNVPINVDILIANIPSIVIPNARLLGLKADLVELGVNVTGKIPTGARFSFTDGTLTLVVPSETGQATMTKNYAYELHAGAPPQIATPTFEPKGNYGVVSITDVNHALGYEWQFGDAGAEWNFFDGSRPIINPSTVDVTPGNLNVTLTFPNIAAATAYEYQLVSEGIETLWKRFTGSLQNNMISTIIPNLEEGVAYDLKLRVASPWVGTPITIKVYGGRLCYALQVNTTQRTHHYLYIFHTGHAKGTTISRIKRLLLPTALTDPEKGGLAVKSNGDVLIANVKTYAPVDRALYTFTAATIDAAADGSRLTQDRRNPFAVINGDNIYPFAVGMAAYNNELYAALVNQGTTNDWGRFAVMTLPSTDGANVTRARGVGYGSTDFYYRGQNRYGISVDTDTIWYNGPSSTWQSEGKPRAADRTTLVAQSRSNALQLYAANGTATDAIRSGLKVIGSTFYGVDSSSDKFKVWRINPAVHATHYVLDFELRLPTGLTNPVFLEMIE